MIPGTLIWLALMGAESIHGILRGLLLVPWIGDLPSRRVGVITGSLIIWGIAQFFSPWFRAWSSIKLFGLGLYWVVLTLLFEIGLGRYVLGYPWSRLLEDYDLTQGGLMGFGLLFLGFCPFLVFPKVSQPIDSSHQ